MILVGFGGAVEDGARSVGTVVAVVVGIVVGALAGFNVGLGVFLGGVVVAHVWGRWAGESFRADAFGTKETESGPADGSETHTS